MRKLLTWKEWIEMKIVHLVAFVAGSLLAGFLMTGAVNANDLGDIATTANVLAKQAKRNHHARRNSHGGLKRDHYPEDGNNDGLERRRGESWSRWQRRKRRHEQAERRARELARKRAHKRKKRKKIGRIIGGALAAGIGAIILNELANGGHANADGFRDDDETVDREQLNMCRRLFLSCDDGSDRASDRACARYEDRCH